METRQTLKFIDVLALVVIALTGCERAEPTRLGAEANKAKVALINFTGSTVAGKEFGLVAKIDGKRWFASPVITGATTGYFTVDPGNREIALDSSIVRVAAPTPEGRVFSQQNPVEADGFYSLFATGPVGRPDVVWSRDELSRPAAGKARVRLVHLSPDAPAVGIATGPVSATALTSLVNPVAYKTVTPFAEVDAGSYTLEVRDAAGKTVPTFSNTVTDAIADPVMASGTTARNAIRINFKEGKVYTLMVRGYLNPTAAGQPGKTLAVSTVINVYW